MGDGHLRGEVWGFGSCGEIWGICGIVWRYTCPCHRANRVLQDYFREFRFCRGRRIEAITADKAEEYILNYFKMFKEIESMFKSNRGVWNV